MENPLRSFTPEYVKNFFEIENEVLVKKEADKIVSLIKQACKSHTSKMPPYVPIPSPLFDQNIRLLLSNGFKVYKAMFSNVWTTFYVVLVPDFDIVDDVTKQQKICGKFTSLEQLELEKDVIKTKSLISTKN